jgi:hypothetical protein
VGYGKIAKLFAAFRANELHPHFAAIGLVLVFVAWV